MKYIKEDIETMLINYKEDEAKLNEIKLKKEEYQERLNYAGTVYKDKETEIIENMQLSTRGYDKIHTNTNKIFDQVANTAINYEKEIEHINKEDNKYLERKILELEEKENKLNKKVVRIKNLLNILTIEEKFVISRYYFERAKWDYVEIEYFDEFEKHKSIKQLQTYRNNALQSMLNILNVGL